MKPTLCLLTALALAGSPAFAQEEQEATPLQTIDSSERITINFKDQDLGTVLEMFSSNYGFNLVYGPNITGSVSLNLFNAPVDEALEQILAANGYGVVEEGSFMMVVPLDQAMGAMPGGLVPMAPSYDAVVYFLDHVRAKDVEPMIKPLLGPGETIVPGPPSKSGIGDIDQLGGNEQATQEMFVLLASEDTRERVDGLLSQIDIPPRQVLVEATILAVTLSEDFQLGVDFSAFGGIDFQALGGTTTISDPITTGPAPGPDLQDWLFGGEQRGFADPSSDGLHVGILKNQVGVFITALEEIGNATVMSNPQVLAINRHAAQVLVGRKLAYLTTTTTQTTTSQNVEFLEVGTQLTFRPFISDDGYVRMEIHPESSDGNINPSTGLPDESTTEVSTNILVKSGHTVVIGGLMETSMTTDVRQVPFLGNLPFLGTFFREESQTENKTEIIVLLTPHIVDGGQLDQRADEARIRVNAVMAEIANSHHGYLRPSIARNAYADAAAALAEGDPEEALACCEWGLSFMPADPDLAALAQHCREEMRAARLEEQELHEAIEQLKIIREELN